ncbi:omega-amidase, chloroplastic-like isoform X2 [Chenopodium quinoa]|uniref:omega-amidase, chloroplastic-like isoform X2 n=1 Tax=Chenopodium quinoa TaxID=63459 RepID=UPI000B7739CD|nr:omega-amidase, chloroplastic-like isoform X2 [Chenopodium quinoa]
MANYSQIQPLTKTPNSLQNLKHNSRNLSFLSSQTIAVKFRNPNYSNITNSPFSTTISAISTAHQSRVPPALPLPPPPITKFKIALCQLSVTSDKLRNISHAREAIEEAANKGAQLVLLPEIWNSPYSNDSFPVYAEDIELGGDASPSAAMLSEVSRNLKITIVGGSIPERRGDRLYNTCCIFGTDGKLKAKHRKIHLFDIDIPGKMTFKESKTLTAGENPTIVDTDVGRIGIGICYDIRFQELAAIYAARGAHLLCYPGAFNMTTGPLHWELLQRARIWQCTAKIYCFSVEPRARSLCKCCCRAESAGVLVFANSQRSMSRQLGMLHFLSNYDNAFPCRISRIAKYRETGRVI